MRLPILSEGLNMITQTSKNQQRHLKEALRAAHVFQDAIYQIARQAMQDTNPHNVAYIVKEHDKVSDIVRNLHTLCNEYTVEPHEMHPD
jgi:hypothetical protein